MNKRVTDIYSFIRKAKLVHGEKYDYSNVVYIKSTQKVEIICKKHGLFHQNPSQHAFGQGCPQCGNLKIGSKLSLDQSQFISKCSKAHNNKYDYSLIKYKNSRSMVTIICPIHKEFEQKAGSHLHGQGCPMCSGNKTRTTEDFIENAIKKHGLTYDYSKADYKGAYSKVKIICKKHGCFEQKSTNHLSGKGCPRCANESVSKYQQDNYIGWSATKWRDSAKKSKNFDSFKVYIIKCWNESEEFYKIGRTFLKTNRRFYGKHNMPYNYEIIKEIVFDNPIDCFNRENELKRLNKLNKYLPNISFGGMYECFSEYPALE